MNPYAKAAESYLALKLAGASPVQVVVTLLARAERELALAVQALARKDYEAKAHATNHVDAILEELMLLVDPEGGEAAAALMRLYTWWAREVMEASATKDPSRLEAVARQMAEIRKAWHLQEQAARTEPAGPGFSGGELIG